MGNRISAIVFVLVNRGYLIDRVGDGMYSVSLPDRQVFRQEVEAHILGQFYDGEIIQNFETVLIAPF